MIFHCKHLAQRLVNCFSACLHYCQSLVTVILIKFYTLELFCVCLISLFRKVKLILQYVWMFSTIWGFFYLQLVFYIIFMNLGRWTEKLYEPWRDKAITVQECRLWWEVPLGKGWKADITICRWWKWAKFSSYVIQVIRVLKSCNDIPNKLAFVDAITLRVIPCI